MELLNTVSNLKLIELEETANCDNVGEFPQLCKRVSFYSYNISCSERELNLIKKLKRTCN